MLERIGAEVEALEKTNMSLQAQVRLLREKVLRDRGSSDMVGLSKVLGSFAGDITPPESLGPAPQLNGITPLNGSTPPVTGPPTPTIAEREPADPTFSVTPVADGGGGTVDEGCVVPLGDHDSVSKAIHFRMQRDARDRTGTVGARTNSLSNGSQMSLAQSEHHLNPVWIEMDNRFSSLADPTELYGGSEQPSEDENRNLRREGHLEVEHSKSKKLKLRGFVRYGDLALEKSCMQRLVASPGSGRQMCWDLLSIVCMLYDVLLFPMQVFPLPESGVLQVCDIGTVVFWTLDIPNSFLTGYNAHGILEMRPRKIARAYLRGLFPLDLLVAIIDWFVLLEMSNVAAADIVRLSKWTRLLRLLRLLRAIRIMKLLSVLLRLADSLAIFFSERILIIMSIFNAMLFILVACHLLACGWYFVGTLEGVNERGSINPSWVQELRNFAGIDQLSLSYRYLTALHWALTQFTPASMEVVPRNSVERVFSIFTVLVALVVFSSFVSSITSSMARMRMINMDKHRLNDNVRRFILDHRLSLDTGARIQNFARTHDARTRSSKKHEQDVTILEHLPEGLRLDLHTEVYMPVLVPHPLFWHHFHCVKDHSLARVCDEAMRESYVSEAEKLFDYGADATSMYFFARGDCKYIKGSDLKKATVTDVPDKSQFSEAALWVNWRHKGSIASRGGYEVVELDARIYQAIIAAHSAAIYISRYARLYLAQMMLLSEPDLSDLNTDMDTALEMAHVAFENASVHRTDRVNRRISRRGGFGHRMTPTREWISSLASTFIL